MEKLPHARCLYVCNHIFIRCFCYPWPQLDKYRLLRLKLLTCSSFTQLSEMNSKMISGKPLYIAFAQVKKTEKWCYRYCPRST
jgi:hypothetical protein